MTTYTAQTTMIGDDLFRGTASGCSVEMDTSGQKRAQSPMELLLSAVSGCASVDVIEIIKKKRRTVNGLTVRVEADRRDEPWPRIFTAYRLRFELDSPDARDSELEQAVKLSMDKYCSVAGALRESGSIDYTWQVINKTPV